MAKKRQRRLPRTAPEGDELVRELEGRQPSDAQEAFLTPDQVDDLGSLGHIAYYEDELAAGVDDDRPSDPESLELLTELELRAGETGDAMEAIEDGETYIPPIDPPTVPSAPGDPQDSRVAAGFGYSAREQPYNEDNPADMLPAEDDMSARVREALLADSATTSYADHVRIITRGSTVILRGLVDDLVDSDNLVEVTYTVHGVDEVIDELDVRSMGLDNA
jgi:hypothetical protein